MYTFVERPSYDQCKESVNEQKDEFVKIKNKNFVEYLLSSLTIQNMYRLTLAVWFMTGTKMDITILGITKL